MFLFYSAPMVIKLLKTARHADKTVVSCSAMQSTFASNYPKDVSGAIGAGYQDLPPIFSFVLV